MKTPAKLEMELDGIVVLPHNPNEGYSAFFAQFPEAIAYGATNEEALENLIDIFKVMMQDKKQQAIKNYVKHEQYTTTSYKMTTILP